MKPFKGSDKLFFVLQSDREIYSLYSAKIRTILVIVICHYTLIHFFFLNALFHWFEVGEGDDTSSVHQSQFSSMLAEFLNDKKKKNATLRCFFTLIVAYVVMNTTFYG